MSKNAELIAKLVSMSADDFGGAIMDGACKPLSKDEFQGVVRARDGRTAIAAKSASQGEPKVVLGEDKGILKFSNVPGKGTDWQTVEGAVAILAMADKIRALIDSDGERLKGLREAYKLTPEFKKAREQRKENTRKPAAK